MTVRQRVQRYMLGRNLYAGRLLESFLVSGVASLVAVRVYLALADYPRLAPGGLHIAHMLWGGLGMLAAIVILLASLSPLGASIAAIIGGIGFGVFIDELGKFVTSDNNYFFEPAIAIIYVIFIVVYLAARGLTKDKESSEQTYLINALELMKNGVLGRFSAAEDQKVRELLARCDPSHPVVQALNGLLREVEVSNPPLGLLARGRAALSRVYLRLRSNRWFVWGVMAFFFAEAVIGLALDVYAVREMGQWLFIWTVVVVMALLAFFWRSTTLRRAARGKYLAVLVILVIGGLAALWFAVRQVQVPRFEFAAWGEVVSSGVAQVIVVIGLLRMRSSRLGALKAFRLALLILILVTQFFSFYRSQLTAGLELAAHLVIYGIVRYMIEEEEELAAAGAVSGVPTLFAPAPGPEEGVRSEEQTAKG